MSFPIGKIKIFLFFGLLLSGCSTVKKAQLPQKQPPKEVEIEKTEAAPREFLEAVKAYAKDQGVSVSEKELELALREYKRKKKDYQEELKELGLTPQQAKEQFRVFLLIQKLKKNISVSEEEVERVKKTPPGKEKSRKQIVEELKEQKLYGKLMPYLERSLP